MQKPKWLTFTDKLIGPLFPIASGVLDSKKSANMHLSQIPTMALFHLFGCLYASIEANERGQHSVAICLIRQCVEALTLIDLGLQEPSYREPLLEKWETGKKSHGEIRKALEQDIWPNYGHGLWDEPWREYFGNLARAVQPYAHYSPEVMGWQMRGALPMYRPEIRYAPVLVLMMLFAIVHVVVFPYTGGTCNAGRRLGRSGFALISPGWEVLYGDNAYAYEASASWCVAR